jgi:hypothetical protein
MGNLLPSLFVIPPIAMGIWQIYKAEDIFTRGLWWIVAGPVLGWLAMNLLGLYQNSTMRSEMSLRLRNMRGGAPEDRVFVGMASPKHNSVIDPHQDVGFLLFTDDRLEYVGELLNVVLKKHDITGVTYRPNAHSVLGLGRWVSVEGTVDGKPVRLMVEPRERNTLWGNKMYGKALKARIEEWLRR